jgi:hypothetical protein
VKLLISLHDKSSPPSPKVNSVTNTNVNRQSCNFEPLKKTMIYHIVQNNQEKLKFRNNKRIIYKPINVSNDLENKITKNIKEDCIDHNILIFLSFENTPTAYESINNILHDLDNDVNLKNTTIINLMEKAESYIYGNKQIKEIINRVTYGDYYENTSKKLEDQWWFQLYFKLPPCSYGRIRQLSGTCWFNSTFNAIMLVPKIAELLKIKWSQLPKEEKRQVIKMENLDRCLSKTAPLKILLYMTIYYILVKGEKSNNNENWVKEVAGYIKSVGLTKTESTYRDLKVADLQNNTNYANSYANGSNTVIAIDVIFGTLFSKNEYFIMDDLLQMWSYQHNLEKKNLIILDLGSVTNMPLLIIFSFPLPIGPLRTSIIVNKTKYSLESGIMSITNETGGHAVSMLRCENRWYIYDSNNILVECDWHKGDINPYINELKNYFIEYANYPRHLVHHLIYVRESF